MDDAIGPDEMAKIAEEAYIYAFPMLMGYRFAYATHLQPASPGYRGPANSGPYGKAIPLDHTYKDVVTANADTPYSFALLDLRAGPVVLSVPAITDRYYVMQFIDLYGCNDLFVGSRATGSDAQTWYLMGPNQQGDVPGGFTGSHRFETELAILAGRTQLLSAADEAACNEVMAQYKLEPYEVSVRGDVPTAPASAWPHWDDAAAHDERFIGYLNALLPLCQPLHAEETELFERFARIGIGPGLPFDADALEPEQRAAIARALSNDPKLIIGDEPTGNLDTVSAGLVFGLFEELVEGGKTIIMVTHDHGLARRFSRKVRIVDGVLDPVVDEPQEEEPVPIVVAAPDDGVQLIHTPSWAQALASSATGRRSTRCCYCPATSPRPTIRRTSRWHGFSCSSGSPRAPTTRASHATSTAASSRCSATWSWTSTKRSSSMSSTRRK